jgi:Flp pilus assembly protein TadB
MTWQEVFFWQVLIVIVGIPLNVWAYKRAKRKRAEKKAAENEALAKAIAKEMRGGRP